MNADKELIASGMACVNLTPTIKQAISSMQGSEMLMVYNDDPASREGVPAWCRLTGHLLIETKEISQTETQFYIQKKI
jgi:tRNA 2-thiouridine synthesizing protein A